MRISRRGFLRTTLVAAGVHAGMPVHGAMRSLLSPPIHLIALANCSESEAFCGAFSGSVRRFSVDVGEVLQDLASGKDAGPGSICLGLTRDSDQLLIRQILIERHSVELYSGRHQVVDGGWRHALQAPASVIGPLADAFAAPLSGWPEALASQAPAIAESTGPMQERIVRNAGAPASGRHAVLVSWAWRVGSVVA